MVDALQHIIGSVCFGSVNFVSVVNQAGAKWFDFAYCALYFEFRYDPK